MEDAVLAAMVAATTLAALHVGARWLTVLDTVPRSRWLSAASGVSVAYVFVHLLPEVAHIQENLGELAAGWLPWLEEHAWLLALAGLAAFYGLELVARRARRRDHTGGGTTPDPVGWLHVASYATYNALVGYLLLEQADRAGSTLVLFAVAMGVHFLVNDHGLRENHGRVYHDAGRWIVGLAILAGWAVSAIAEVSEAAVGMLLAFLAGSVVLNVLKEELPEARQSRFGPFAAGAVAYAGLLLAV